MFLKTKKNFLKKDMDSERQMYLQVVFPDISMMHWASRVISLMLKGRTRTATLTDDIFPELARGASKLTYQQLRIRPPYSFRHLCKQKQTNESISTYILR